MAPSKTGKVDTKEKKAKKEKIFHPESRKAGQLARTQIRKSKLAGQASKRAKKHSSLVDFYGFFHHALPEEGELTLEDMHAIIGDVWLARHDAELEEERAARRKGRPKSVKEMKLEEMKLRESEQYRTGMGAVHYRIQFALFIYRRLLSEVPDLTHHANVALFRKWDQIEVAYVHMLRFIRITSAKLDIFVLSRQGRHSSLIGDTTNAAMMEDQAMDIVDAPLLADPVSRFSSTIMAMDEPA
ncbi:hypothetical protein EW146_g5723 [Bondarzewia mesenterica]|uniref:Uncharacterized protein n=1 Tax=Bondarzewia mesenterica TaxID=1095465 RepID=A0A4S4LSP0_9AGAM|nr:hypothetical protein EW146_g5723 [Bondarzewia mesenterica]